jgi:hypothetical protein
MLSYFSVVSSQFIIAASSPHLHLYNFLSVRSRPQSHSIMGLNTTASDPESAAMEFQTIAGLAHTLQTAAVAALIFAACTYIPRLRQRAQLAKLPTISSESYLKSAKELYKEGYQKVSPSQT